MLRFHLRTALMALTLFSCGPVQMEGVGAACAITSTGVDPCLVELTCDVSIGKCVKQKPCEGQLVRTCPGHIVCLVDPNAFEGQVVNHNFPNGCSLNCMAAPTLEAYTAGTRRCEFGFVCDDHRLCTLGTVCTRGSNAACHGPNCGPAGVCVEPVPCTTATDTSCPNGLLCDELTHLCFSSCATQSECRAGLRCDATTGGCLP